MKLVRIILLLICIGIAWYLGYRARPKEEDSSRAKSNKVPKDYFIGLNFLLNEETDKAVDVFVKMLEVDSETVETHLAVAKLFRRRGEVDRAIRIHQNLIARPQLERAFREQSLYELGQDYLSAGMLDRAERAFLELVDTGSYSALALKTLIDIYQQEKEWAKAIEMAEKYERQTRLSLQPMIAHFHCELAEIALHKNDLLCASDHLEKAARSDKACVRAGLLQAKLHMQEGRYNEALVYLKNIKDQNPDYLSESIDLLASCYENLGQEDALVIYLNKLVEEYPRVPVVLILAERIRKWKGDKVAVTFVADYVRRYPSLRGLYLFINLFMGSAEGSKAKNDLHIIQKLMKKVLAGKPDYQCRSCGFSGKSLHWQCPGCREWTTVLPIHSLEETI